MKKTLLAAVSIAGLIALSGCGATNNPTPTPTQSATPTPSASPTKPATSTPTPTAAPTPAPTEDEASIVINADYLTVTRGDTTETFNYDGSPEGALAAVTAAYGHEGSYSYSGEQKCWYQMSSYTWPGLEISFSGEDAASTPNFLVRSLDDPTEVLVSSPQGAVVGQSWSAYYSNASVSLEPVTGVYEGKTYFRFLDTPTPNPDPNYGSQNGVPTYGVVVTGEEDFINAVLAPEDLNGDC